MVVGAGGPGRSYVVEMHYGSDVLKAPRGPVEADRPGRLQILRRRRQHLVLVLNEIPRGL